MSENNMQNLKIRFYLQSPVVLNRLTTMDSILIHEYFNSLEGSDKPSMGKKKFIMPNKDNIDFIDSKSGVFSGSIWYIDSIPAFDNNAIIKNIDLVKYTKWTPDYHNQMNLSSGQYKTYHIEIESMMIDSVYFYIRGNTSKIKQLCSNIKSIGRHQSIGYGIISHTDIEEIGKDRGFLLDRGNPAKPLPTKAFKEACNSKTAFYRAIPPYYLRDGKTTCYMPRTSLLESRSIIRKQHGYSFLNIDYISPSQLACEAANLKPTALPHNPNVCGACGKHFDNTILITEALRNKPGFNDYSSIKGKYICGYCLTSMTVIGLRTFSNRLIDKTIHEKLFGNKDMTSEEAKIFRDRFVRNITNLEPPFTLAFKSIRNNQHIIWKSTVCISSSIIPVQFGGETLFVDTDLLQKAISDMDYGLLKKKNIINKRSTSMLPE